MNLDQQKQLEMQLLNQHLQQLQEQIRTLHGQVAEVKAIREDLEELELVKNKDSITPLGAGIFLETKIKDVKNVLLNVGAGVMVKKDINSAKKIIEKQIRDLEKIILQIETNMTQGIMQLEAAQ